MPVVVVSPPRLVPVSLPSLTILVLTAPSCECAGGFLHPSELLHARYHICFMEHSKFHVTTVIAFI